MATGYERYRQHPVWDTLKLKRDALEAARFDDAMYEQARQVVVERLDEAQKTKVPRQPAVYLSALDLLGSALNQLPVDAHGVQQFWMARFAMRLGSQPRSS